MTNSTRPLDEEYLERVRRARAMSPAEKLLAGEILFRERERATIADILERNPGMSREEALEIFEQELALEDTAEQSVRRFPGGVLNP